MSRFTRMKAFTAFEARNFRLYFFGQCFALTGSWMFRVALTWLVLTLTGSGEKMGLVEFLNQCPVFFIGLFIGIFLDKADLRKVLICTQIAMILQSLLLALLMYLGTINYLAVTLLSFLLGIISAVDMPARQASISQMIDHPSQLQSALSLQSSSFNLARLLGPTVAGFVIRYSGEMACFIINAVAHLAVLYAYMIMRLPERKTSPKNLGVLESLREGLAYMWGVTPIRLCTFYNYIFCFLAVPYVVLMPLFVTRLLGGDERHYGFMLGGIGFGALCGALFIAFRVSLRHMSRHIWRMQILFSIALLLYSRTENWLVALAITPVLGFAITSSLVANNSLIQGLVDEDKRGRVLSYYSFGLLGFGPLGAFLAGKAADMIDVQIALTACAACALVISVLHMLRQKDYDATVPEILKGKGLA
ncbi:MAG: Enterobactin exporter EntS [Desulfovibrio sp.]